MDKNLRKIARMFEGVDEHERTIFKQYLSGSFNANEVPGEILARFEDIKALRERINDLSIKDGTSSKTTQFRSDSKSEALVNTYFQSCQSFHRTIELITNPEVKAQILRSVAVKILDDETLDFDAVTSVICLRQRYPELDFEGVMVETFNRHVQNRRWSQAYAIYDHYLGHRATERLTSHLNQEAREALAILCLKDDITKIHLLEMTTDDVASNMTSQVIADRLRGKLHDSIPEEELLQDLRYNRMNIIRLVAPKQQS